MRKLTSKIISASVGLSSVLVPTTMVAMNATSTMAAESHTTETWFQDYGNKYISLVREDSSKSDGAAYGESYSASTYSQGQKKFNQQAQAAANWYKKQGKTQASEAVYDYMKTAREKKGTVTITKRDGKYSVVASYSVKTNVYPGGYGASLFITEDGALSGKS